LKIPAAKAAESLGMLALGAQGVPLWRRKQENGNCEVRVSGER